MNKTKNIGLAITLIGVAAISSGCVSTATYKRDMASISKSINIQNEINSATVDTLQSHKQSIEVLRRGQERIDVWDIRGRTFTAEKSIKTLMEFKDEHDKRWPPPVKLNSGKTQGGKK